jgi:hypothetical protein
MQQQEKNGIAGAICNGRSQPIGVLLSCGNDAERSVRVAVGADLLSLGILGDASHRVSIFVQSRHQQKLRVDDLIGVAAF